MTAAVSPTTIRFIGTLTALMLFSVGLLHVYWAAGGLWGSSVTIPTRNHEPLFQPSTFATLIVAVLLFAAGSIILGRAGSWGGGLPRWPFAIGAWVLTAVFAARVVGDFRWIGVFKAYLSSDFASWDTWLFVPLCAVIALGCGIVAYAGD